jgi:hypothetical protein
MVTIIDVTSVQINFFYNYSWVSLVCHFKRTCVWLYMQLL